MSDSLLQLFKQKLPPLWQKSIIAALPWAVAGLGISAHFWLNVPNRMVEASPKDQGVGQKPAAPAAASRPAPPRKRTAQEHGELLQRFTGSEFLSEPVDRDWASSQQELLERIVNAARSRAFAGAPEPPQVVLSRVECKTVRCRFVLRGPYAHELRLLADALAKLGEQQMWSSFETAALEDSPEEKQLQVTVGFAGLEVKPEFLRQPADADTDTDPGNEGEPTISRRKRDTAG